MAAQGTVEDFVLVNKRFSTVHVIDLDAVLDRHRESIRRVDLSYNYLRNRPTPAPLSCAQPPRVLPCVNTPEPATIANESS